MLAAIVTISALVILIGFVLLWLGQRLQPDDDDLVEQINQVLPQTQCAQCGYPGCRPYARAIADGEADINQCPPGGDAGIRALADLSPISSPNLWTKAAASTSRPWLALIDEGSLYRLHALYFRPARSMPFSALPA